MTTLSIPIAKGGKTAIFAVEDIETVFGNLPAEKQLEIIGAGLEKYLNAGMSSSDKFPAPTKLEGEALETAKAAALAKAQNNLEELQSEKPLKSIKYNAEKAKAKPATAEDRQILSAAMTKAKAVLKSRARAQGIKPLSAVPTSKWTELATIEIKTNPQYLIDAKAAVAAQNAMSSELDLTALIVISPEAAAKARAKSAKSKPDVDQLSATQSGQPRPHGKGKIPPARPQQNPQHTAH